MVKVENIMETPSLLKGGRQRPNFKNLPQSVGSNFETFKLHALSLLGDLDPWDSLPDDGIQGLWNALCADYHISCSDKDRIDSYQRFRNIKKLVHFSAILNNYDSNRCSFSLTVPFPPGSMGFAKMR
jgi:hypothetical protein